MSSPPTRKFEERSQQDNWDADPPGEPSITHGNLEDQLPHRESEESNRPTGRHDTDEPLSGSPSPSKTAGNLDSGASGAQSGTIYREKEIRPNKVYVGGLPEHTRKEDLQSCFGKIGRIVSIELKIGFGFVEFEDRQAAEESVAKYNEGYFMGNRIRVEISHGGSRSARYSGDPGACFKCGQMGHWARECPNHVVSVGHRRQESTLMSRVAHAPRDLPSRGYSPPRGDYRSSKESRYGYQDSPPPLVPPRDNQDYRPRDYRPLTPPPRDYRDDPIALRSSRDVDEYRRDSRGSYSSRYDTRGGFYSDIEYSSRQSYPSSRDLYDSRPIYDRRPSVSGRYPPPPAYGRSRTPPRHDYDRPPPPPPPRDYPEYRGRPMTPSRYPPENGRGAGDSTRFRRRSLSPGRPVPNYGPGNPSTAVYNGGGYSSSSGNFPGGYPSASRSSATRDRDYPSRSSRDTGDYVRRP